VKGRRKWETSRYTQAAEATHQHRLTDKIPGKNMHMCGICVGVARLGQGRADF
jgi:hypothetical protein